MCFSNLWCLIAIEHLPLLECAPISLHQYVKKMSCLRVGLPNTWNTSESKNTDHRGSAKQTCRSASVNCENYTLVLELGSSTVTEQAECNLSRSICGCLSLLNLIPKLLDSLNVINKLQSEL